jgi:cell surface protein SprA
LKRKKNYIPKIFILLLFIGVSVVAQTPTNSVQTDSITPLPYNFSPTQYGDLFLNGANTEVIYDSESGKYIFVEKIGDYYIKSPIFMTADEYKEYRLKRDMLDYFKTKISAVDGKKKGSDEAKKDLLPKYYVNSKFFESIFGGNKIEVNLQGNVLIKMGVLYQKTENPLLSERNRQSTTFDFDQQISASVNAKVGTRVNVNINYDTQSTFDFQNLIKLEYTPTEDDIIQKIEVGNVSMPLQSSLIKGAQNLFGFKTKLQFGATDITAVFAKQQSQTRSVATQGGATVHEFEIKGSEYDKDRHFFLAHKYRENYNNALLNLPLINSSTNITRIEVWITNRNNETENVRTVVALADLAEGNPVNFTNSTVTPLGGHQPSNEANSLVTHLTQTDPIRNIATVSSALPGFLQGTDFSVVVNAKKLIQGRDFTLHPTLGYITLNRPLAESEVLSVAYEYTEFDPTTNEIKTYQVGELTSNGIEAPNNLVVKLLRPEIINTNIPLWKLMMKNIYDLRSRQLNSDGFRLEVMYKDPSTGAPINTLQNAQTPNIVDRTLLNLLLVDRLDSSQNPDANGDGYFDYVEGITIDSQNGLIIFPVVEPFGNHLDNILTDPADDIYVFSELYNNTQSTAQNNYQNKDKYILKGYYKSEGTNGIPLGAFNVPRGSVVVTTGGRTLAEGVDYIVDYQIGNVQIINPSLIASNAPIQVSVETNNSFSTQNRRFMGMDVQHKFSDKLAIGGTFLNLREKPFTQKAQFGNEPVNNSIVGFNLTYNSEIPFLTKIVNHLPNINTDAPSNLSVRAEAAYLFPNSPKSIELNGEAASYLDDFEGTQIPLNIDSPAQWKMASVPLKDPGNPNPFIDNNEPSNLRFGNKRSKLAWYSIDRIFYGSTLRPDNIDEDELSRAETRSVTFDELFPNEDLDITQSNLVRTFDLAYFPEERGSYNYDVDNVDSNTGKFTDPEDRWAGITRALTTTDFQQANVEYIQFWMMNPFENYSLTEQEGATQPINPSDLEGELYFNLGNISEDVLHDDLKMFEHGLPEDGNIDPNPGPTQNVMATDYSYVPITQALINAFAEDDQSRKNQDVGLDGKNLQHELTTYQNYINALSGNARALAELDPSSDDYRYFKNTDVYDAQNASIIRRYKDFNNTEGNSPTLNNSDESFPTAATPYPDVEDLNRDQTLSTAESYFEYKVSVKQSDFVVGQNNIVDSKITTVTLPNGTEQTTTWYQFRIPVQTVTDAQRIGGISDFNSIRFMRMYLTKFKKPIVLRLGKLELVRGTWRRYTKHLEEPIPNPPLDLTPLENQSFEVGTVSIQENESRVPIPYVLPPGLSRERLQGSTSIQLQNEQSLSVKVKSLEPNQVRAVYKNTSFDLRMFKRFRMFIHVEGLTQNGPEVIEDDEVAAIVRLGSDLTDNYYQIEVPLKVSDFSARTAEEVWKNDIDAALEKFGKLRLERFENNVQPNVLFPANGKQYDGYKLYVKGNPSLAKVETMMLGIKNISSVPKSAELWFNEMRTVDFDNEGGWSALVNANLNLADFADIAANGSISTKGFGSIDQRVNERSQDDTKQYDIVSNVNIGQLLPKKVGLQLPLNVSIAETVKTPKYDPQYQDVLYEETNDINSPNRENANDYTKRRSISLMNVRKERTNLKKKQRPWDVENISVSFAYSDVFHRDYNVEKYLDKNVRASAGYNYAFESKPIEPFKNVKLISKKKYLKLLKDFNISLLPKNISVNSNILRAYNEQLIRPLVDDPSFPQLPTLERRNYAFDWDYNIAYDLTKSLKFNFRAANSYIYDDFDRDINGDITDAQIFDKFFNIGRPQHYHQKLDASYKIPINKIPYLDFVTANYNYTADFDWKGNSDAYVDLIGNTIQNANTHNFNADFNMNKLYKTLGVTKLFRKRSKIKNKKTTNKKDDKKGKSFDKGKDQKGLSKQKQSRLSKTSRGGRFNRKKLPFGKKVILGLVDIATSVKKVKISYTENNGTLLPGYKPEVGFLGRDNYSGSFAPNLGFVFGSQQNILQTAYSNNWLVTRLSTDPFYNKVYSNTHFEDLKINMDVKPFKNLRIDVLANKTKTRNISQQIDIISDSSDPNYNPFDVPVTETGNFAISNMMIGTAFIDGDELFQNFLDYRAKIAQRLANSTGQNINGFSNGDFSQGVFTNQSVVLPAFFAAYSGRDANKVKLSAFRSIPLPNWRVSYRGLSKLKVFKKKFRSITLEHNYQSTYAILGFNSNLQYDSNNINQVDIAGNYVNETLFQGVSLVERFSPLIKLEIKMKNSFSFKGEIKKDRALDLNFANSSITEVNGKEYVLGLGYKIKNVKWKIKTGAIKTIFKGDINLKADVGLRDNITVIRSIQTGTNQITGGQRIFTIKFTADYNLNKNMMASFFYDQNSSRFKISTTFPRNSISTGISLRYNLGN